MALFLKTIVDCYGWNIEAASLKISCGAPRIIRKTFELSSLQLGYVGEIVLLLRKKQKYVESNLQQSKLGINLSIDLLFF